MIEADLNQTDCYSLPELSTAINRLYSDTDAAVNDKPGKKDYDHVDTDVDEDDVMGTAYMQQLKTSYTLFELFIN